MLVKSVIPVSFYLVFNIVITRKFKITRVAHIILLLDRIALDIAHVPCSRFRQEEKKNYFVFTWQSRKLTFTVLPQAC